MNRIESHRLHLNALASQERDPVYQRRDYLSRERRPGQRKNEAGEGALATTTTTTTTTTTPDRSPVSVNMMSSPPPVLSDAPSRVCILWREKIVEWKYEVVDQFNLDREIVSISTFYLDRYLEVNYDVIDKQLFQLVAMTCIYLAIKIHSPTKVTIVDFASLGNGQISPEHIARTELSIMECLEWRLFPPTPASFVRNFLPLLSRDCGGPLDDNAAEDVTEFATFLSELSVCAHPFASARPSSIAVAAILMGFERLGLAEETREAFRAALASNEGDDGNAAATTPRFEVDSPEVRACGDLLRRVYHLAVPEDPSLFWMSWMR